MIKIDQRQLNQADVLALYQAVGWNMYTRDPKKLERAIAQSLSVLGAHDGNRLVGLIRAVGDGETILFIQEDRKSTRLNSSHEIPSRMPSSA